MSDLQRAIELAVKAHRKQEDPPGEPYILHPMRVMLRFADRTTQTAAILHDVVERAGISPKELRRAKFDKSIVRAIELLTHDKSKSTYADYVIALSKDPLAKAVKIADLLDNASLPNVTFRVKKAEKDSRRVVRYALSYKFLIGEIKITDYRRLMKAAEN